MVSKTTITLSLLCFLNLLAIGLNICFGSVSIPLNELRDPRWHYILWESRMPAAITAMLTGASLGVCGLLLQSYFRNPLAGPSILGITSGANMMVAIVTLGFGATLATSSTGILLAAVVGALGVLLLLLGLGRVVRQQVALLIVGILLSYLSSALITLITYYSSAQGVQNLMVWGMGHFGGVGMRYLFVYSTLNIATLALSSLLIKPLNGWMQGELYATSLGFNLQRMRMLLLGCAGLLAAITTAWCGPIAFVGLSMPQVARMLLQTDDHRKLWPASLLLGALCCSLCLTISTLPERGSVLPINALTPVFGVPVILLVILRRR